VLDINDMKVDLMQAQIGLLRMYMYTTERERELNWQKKLTLLKELRAGKLY
jgi:hypothetical protein